MPGLPIVFFILAAIAIATALGTLLSRNAVYAALFLVLNFATIAVLYLILGAPFIALSQITVYAGSIMVLFLFVIMLLGAERLPGAEGGLRWHYIAAIGLAVILIGEFAVNLVNWSGLLPAVAQVGADYGAPVVVGRMLFTQYALPFEVTALILLSATVGAVILAKPDRPSVGKKVRQISPSIPAPAGAPSAAEKVTPAAEQEKVLK